MINRLLPERRSGLGRAGAKLTAAAIAGILALTGCTGEGDGASSDAKPALRIGLPATMKSLDPARDNSDVHNTMRALTAASIIHMNPNGSLGPGLATKWRYVGSGNKEFEFTLRQDARFSDGAPVNADAVKKWLDYFQKAHGPNAAYMQTKSVEAMDEWTVRLHLASPNPDIPLLLSEVFTAGFVSSPKAVADPAILGTRTFGAGPYTVDPSQSVSDSKYTLVPNRFYHTPEKIRFSKVVVKIIKSPSSMLAAMRSGQLDVAFGDQTTESQAKSAGLKVLAVPTGAYGMIITDRTGVNVKPLGDLRVRQALNYALDRKAIVTGLYGRTGKPTSEYLTLNGFDPSYQNYYRYDPAKAKALLTAAGYPNGFTLKVLSTGFVGGPGGTALAQAIGKYLAAVGVKLDITSAATQGQFQQELPSFPVLAGPLPAFTMAQVYAALLGPGGLANPFKLPPPQTLARLYQQGATTAPDKASAYWRRMSREITREAYTLPVVLGKDFWYSSENVHGLAAVIESRFPLATEWNLT